MYKNHVCNVITPYIIWRLNLYLGTSICRCFVPSAMFLVPMDVVTRRHIYILCVSTRILPSCVGQSDFD